MSTIEPQARKRILRYLEKLYGGVRAAKTIGPLTALLEGYRPPGEQCATTSTGFSPRDVVLIAYADQVQAPAQPPLRTLKLFMDRHLQGIFDTIHLLPFYPFSSDGGFAVIDFKAVAARFGTWTDIRALAHGYRLMADLVLNHVSSQNRWFQAFLNDDPAYRDYFITPPAEADLSRVFRPRVSPLLTCFETRAGKKRVWTTFSADQIDLNYQNPQVFLELIEVVLFYLAQGISLLRLDAVPYVWKTLGTTCVHLEQTHRFCRLLRTTVATVAPGLKWVAEVNDRYPHYRPYLGAGEDQAHMVYQFSLPPLLLDAVYAARVDALVRWAEALEVPTTGGTFLNFSASHDGIGLRPVQGLLDEHGLARIVAQVKRRGGLVSAHDSPQGTRNIYELNITFFDAVADPELPADHPLNIQVFLMTQAVVLAMAGVAGIYLSSLIGSRNDSQGVARTGHNRAINRHKWPLATMEQWLASATSREGSVFAALRHLIATRKAQDAFHPHGGQTVVRLGGHVFGLLRTAPDGTRQVLALNNFTPATQNVSIAAGLFTDKPRRLTDLLSGKSYGDGQKGGLPATLAAYQVLWLTPVRQSCDAPPRPRS